MEILIKLKLYIIPLVITRNLFHSIWTSYEKVMAEIQRGFETIRDQSDDQKFGKVLNLSDGQTRDLGRPIEACRMTLSDGQGGLSDG